MRINDDLKVYTGNSGFKKKNATIIFNPCFHSVFLYRLSNFFYRLHLNIIAKIIWYFNRVVFNVDIDYRADLAGGFALIHGMGTVIGMNVKSLGKLIVYQGVTIGGTNNKVRKINGDNLLDQPIIGNNVIIYTDAKIFGPVIIGDNNIIKASSIVTKDMEKK